MRAQAGIAMPPVVTRPRVAGARYLEGLRRERAARYADRPARRGNRRAVQTIVHNEPLFLPIFLRYYSRFFAPQDIYVLDNDTTDGSTDGGEFVRLPVGNDAVDHVWMMETLAAHERELLDDYDVVLTVDVDEIVCPTPAWGTLDAYLDRLDESYVNATGYEIIHMRDREPPFDPARPVLEQRGFWFANGGYSKPALAMEPLERIPGLHSRTDLEINLDPDLYLIHLHRIDFELCRERHRLRRARRWNDRDVRDGWAAYNRLAESQELERWFYSQSGFERFGIELVVEPIPDEWRGAF